MLIPLSPKCSNIDFLQSRIHTLKYILIAQDQILNSRNQILNLHFENCPILIDGMIQII